MTRTLKAHKIHVAGKVRRKQMRLRANAFTTFTSARDMSRLIEDMAKTLDDYHYISMRTPTGVTVNFIHGRRMTINIETDG